MSESVEVRQFLKFAVVGIASASADVGVLTLLHLSGVLDWISVTAGFFTGLFLNYFLHACFTFNTALNYRSLIKFMLVVLVNYLITMFCVFQSSLWLDSILAGKLGSLPFVAGNGFVLSKYWVYKK